MKKGFLRSPKARNPAIAVALVNRKPFRNGSQDIQTVATSGRLKLSWQCVLDTTACAYEYDDGRA